MEFLKKALKKVIKSFKNPYFTIKYIINYVLKLFAKYFLRFHYPVCRAAIIESTILSDGSVTTCCIDTKGENTYGNICEQSFEQIWNDKFYEFRKKNLYDNKVCFSCIGNKTKFSPKFKSTKKERDGWKSKKIPFPENLVLEISGVCNYACNGCFTNELVKYRKPFFDFESAKKNLEVLLKQIKKLRLYNWGTFIE